MRPPRAPPTGEASGRAQGVSDLERSILLALAAAAMLAAPTGVAQWSSFGDREPTTPYDDASFMFPDPTVSGTLRKVYFNAFFSMYAPGPNPNVASLGTRNEVVPIETPWAILGVWRDCNGDGYVGMAEGALREYDAVLLTDGSICRAASGDIDLWDGVSHNYNGWVTELIPIGNDAVDTTSDTRQLHDPDVMVWADFGQPDVAAALSGGSCPINPLPRGATQSTGGLIEYADCGTGLMAAMNLPWAEGFRVAGQEIAGLGDVAGLRFQQDEFGQERAKGHPIWDQQTFGDESSERSAVRIADCDAEPFFDSGETLNESAPEQVAENELLQNVTIYALDPQPGSPDPTVPGTVNTTSEELLGDCDTTDQSEGVFYGAVEGDSAPVTITGKRTAAYNYAYQGGLKSRDAKFNQSYDELGIGDEAREAGLGDELVVQSPRSPGRAGISTWGGQGLFPILASDWFGGFNLIKGVPNTVALRTDLGEGTADPGPDGAYWMSHWAYVGPASTDAGLRLPGGSGKYGAAQCGLNTSGLHNGWDCNAANWNLNSDGTPIDSGANRRAIPGSPYNLRDVDCYDGGNDLGVGLGVPYYGEQRCP